MNWFMYRENNYDFDKGNFDLSSFRVHIEITFAVKVVANWLINWSLFSEGSHHTLEKYQKLDKKFAPWIISSPNLYMFLGLSLGKTENGSHDSQLMY